MEKEMIYVLLVIIAGLLCLNAALLWLIASNQKASHNNMSYKLNALTCELRGLNEQIGTIQMIMNAMACEIEKVGEIHEID
jgi:hypothetical protein